MEQLSSIKDQVRDVFLLLHKPVHRYLCATVGNRAEADDLTQETFIRLHHTMRKGEQIDNLRAWVFRVAHNLAVNSSKRVRHEPIGLLQDESILASGDLNAEEDFLEREELNGRRIWISAALRRLTAQERQCLELRAEGLRFREIAEILSVKIPTVQTVLTRAIKKMTRPEDTRVSR